MVLGNGVDVRSAGLAKDTFLSVVIQIKRLGGNTRERSADHHWPDVAETLAIGEGVSVNSRIPFEEVDHVVDVPVDLPLVGRGSEAVLVVDAGELAR